MEQVNMNMERYLSREGVPTGDHCIYAQCKVSRLRERMKRRYHKSNVKGGPLY